MNLQAFEVRRRPASPRRCMYGKYAPYMHKGEKFYEDMVDRAAYIYTTGTFPSHLRRTYTDVLRGITEPYRKPSSLDGRHGRTILKPQVAEDMQIERHPMVRAVREKLRECYLIQPSRGFGTRRPFWRVFMFRLDGKQMVDRITVQGDGSVKKGW